MYQVINWEDHFEGAKSKGYNNKTTCQMPTKHGLGYRRLVKQKNGAALFGAWCAMIQLLSRQEKPRQGYLTDTGRDNGIPLLPEDLELLCDIPEDIFKQMLQVCACERVGWLKDTTGIPQETEVSAQYPLNSDLDLDLDSDSDSDSDLDLDLDSLSCGKPLKRSERITFDYDTGQLQGIEKEDIDEWQQAYPAVEITLAIMQAKQWLIDNPSKRKKDVPRFLSGWFRREQEKGGGGARRNVQPLDNRETRSYGLND